VSGPSAKLPIASPRSSITPITPSGVAMNSVPTTAKLTARKRIVATTMRSAAWGLTREA
jgi:hypothetical protein